MDIFQSIKAWYTKGEVITSRRLLPKLSGISRVFREVSMKR